MVALANKECLVCAGALFMRRGARRDGATLLPVDSEHNAIFQCFDRQRPRRGRRLILTASGGPFRSASRDDDGARRRRSRRCAHPNWYMGAKISVDCATMMNKGLELIEAHHLFGLPEERIEIVVHPQSIIHGLVAYRDGSVLAQLGSPDMRTPIAYALGWPGRIDGAGGAARLRDDRARSTFEPPDPERFPALRLAREALLRGGGSPDRAQRGQRDGGGRVPGRAASAFSTSPRWSSETLERCLELPEPRSTWKTSTVAIARRDARPSAQSSPRATGARQLR